MIGNFLGNRYEIIEKIGEGGMAEVYRAKDHLLNRFVAVKILKNEFGDDDELVQKFKQEATIAANLSNNNIVNTYDVGSQDNMHYIVMEYVKGKTLKEIIRNKGKLSSEETIDIAIQIAKALDCAHKNDLIHRDIKPQNILVTDDGLVKVTDFGIAKAASSVTITNSNRIMGSAHYFSPEQAKGNYIDCRTDIYSLGIVMYEMVTGVLPYDADSPVSVAIKHIQEQVKPPKMLTSDIYDSLNDLILKAIEKEPIKRYQTASDMLYDLQKIKEDPNFKIAKRVFDDEHTRIMDPVKDSDILDSKKDTDAKKDADADSAQEPEADEENPEELNEEENNLPKDKKKMSKKKKILLFISLFVVLAITGAFAGYAFNQLGSKKNSGTVVVPNIINMSKSDAEKKVTDLGLKFTVAEYQPSDKKKDTVISCNPDVGMSVKASSEIRVVLSNGKGSKTVPSVEGVNLSNAEDIIKNSGFTVGDVTYSDSDSIDKGCVINQDPSADTNADAGSKINLVVSTGPKNQLTVPNVQGMTVESAISAISAKGLKVTSVIYNGNQISSGQYNGKEVIGTNPAAGSSVNSGDGVSITVGDAPNKQ